MIEQLTPEQELLKQEFRARYFNYGWSTEPANRPAAEDAMRALYAQLEKPAPQFVWFDSPKAAVDCIFESTGVKESLSGCDGAFDACWWCIFRFAQQIKPDVFTQEQCDKLAPWDTLAQSTGPCFPYTKVCLMSERPIVAKFNSDELLHCDDGPALLYRDGYAVYAINGVRLPAKLGQLAVESPWELTHEHVSSDVNEDVRTVLIDRWCYPELDSAGERVGSGGGRFLAETGSTQIDADVGPVGNGEDAVLRALLCDREGRKWLACSDSSTDRVYYIEVPEHVTTCSEAFSELSGGITDDVIIASS